MDNWIARIFLVTLSVFYIVLSVLGVVWVIDYIREHKKEG